jgi:hypothetical protein
MKKCLSIWSALVLVAGAIACDKQNPATPTEPAAVAGAVTPVVSGSTGASAPTSRVLSVTLTTPLITAPTDGQQIRFSSQPITLTVKNAATTGSAALTYAFQIATDAGFANIAFSKDAVPAGSGGSTSVTADPLPGATNYFVRAQAASGGQLGPFTKTRAFSVGPQVTLQTPALAAPGAGSTVSGNLTLTVNNVARTGPAGAVFYRFDLGDSASFSNIIFTQTIPEVAGSSTSVTVSATSLAAGTYFARVQAGDPLNAVTTPYSAVVSFVFTPFSMAQATIVNSPYDLGTWAQTSNITSVVFTGGAFLVDFDERDGPNRWPDTPFGAGSIEYTLGMCLNISSHWYCSAVVQFWYGRDLAASGNPGNIAAAWFYSPRWGPMTGYQPAEGEIVGLFACAGNCRNNTQGDQSYVKERTNVAFVPWTLGGASYSFSAGGIKLQSKSKR